MIDREQLSIKHVLAFAVKVTLSIFFFPGLSQLLLSCPWIFDCIVLPKSAYKWKENLSFVGYLNSQFTCNRQITEINTQITKIYSTVHDNLYISSSLVLPKPYFDFMYNKINLNIYGLFLRNLTMNLNVQ